MGAGLSGLGQAAPGTGLVPAEVVGWGGGGPSAGGGCGDSGMTLVSEALRWCEQLSSAPKKLGACLQHLSGLGPAVGCGFKKGQHLNDDSKVANYPLHREN